MLCERCRENIATVQMTIVEWSNAEPVTHEFCASCSSLVEAERTKGYNSQPTVPLTINVENITASEFLEIHDKARLNGADQPARRELMKKLARLPETRQRLVFELLPLAWQSLEEGLDPRSGAFLLVFSTNIKSERSPEYVTWLEKIIFKSFELRKELERPPGAYGPFALILSMTLMKLSRVDRNKFTPVIEKLKQLGGRVELDPRWDVIDRAEKRAQRGNK